MHITTLKSILINFQFRTLTQVDYVTDIKKVHLKNNSVSMKSAKK